MKFFRHCFLPATVFVVLIGCSRPAAVTRTSETAPLQQPTREAAAPTPSAQPAAATEPGPESTRARASAPPGLIYCSADSLWATTSDGSRLYLAPDCRGSFSPDYKYLLYEGIEDHYLLDLSTGETAWELGLWNPESDPEMQHAQTLSGSAWSPDSKTIYFTSGPYSSLRSEIWAFDLQTGTKINLSQTENRREQRPRIFGSGDHLLFSSQDLEEILPTTFGQLTWMEADGSSYQVLSDGDHSGYFRLSPDRQTAAVFGGHFYGQKSGFQKFSPRVIPDDPELELHLFAPSWSPHGKHIAWSIRVDTGQESYQGIGIHDVKNETIQLFYPYIIGEGEGFPDAPGWSPNSEWITVQAADPESNQRGLFVIHVDGTREHFLASFDHVVWGTESQKMILNPGNIQSPQQRGVWITSLESLDPVQLNLPRDAVVLEWIDPARVNRWKGSGR